MSDLRLESFTASSAVMGQDVPMLAVLPPGFEASQTSLPLIIELHGGGVDCNWLMPYLPLFEQMFRDGTLAPAVLVSFSSGPMSWYSGDWPQFIVDELPRLMAERFGTRSDREGLAITGASMGGYGALKVAFSAPGRFAAVAAMEPAIEPSLARLPDHRRNTWYRTPEGDELVWGPPFDERRWLAEHPTTIARDNAAALRDSGLTIYLECGDQDYVNFHDGSEYLHRILWDHDIRHEYHLVHWADHIGASWPRRLIEVHDFLSAALAGGRAQAVDLSLTEIEQAFVDWCNGGILRGEPPPDYDLSAHPERAPSVHAALWAPRREKASGDPDMARHYARLPPTS